MEPYNEPFVLDVAGPAFKSAYAEAGRVIGDDPGYAVWPARLQRDIDGGLTPAVSLDKHLRELRAALGLGPHTNPNEPAGTEAGRLRVDGLVFRREDGSIFQWRGSSEFLLFKRFRNREDLTALLSERIELGANVLRVLGMVSWAGQAFGPDGDGYYQDLGAFADLLASRGLRFEFVVFADAQISMPNLAQERAHLNRVISALAEKWNVFIEICNEPFKNIPGGGATANSLGMSVQGHGLLIASGAVIADGAPDWPPMPPLDYGTHHPERTAEWPRKAKDAQDLRDATHVPWVLDEPMGFDEVASGSRSASPDDAAYFAATAALMGAGATFHSTDGINAVLFRPVQLACARAFFDAMRFVSPEAQQWPYQRGDPGSEEGIGHMPILHDDATELRSFCKGNGNVEYCVQIRTSRAHATPRDGWRIVEEPRHGLSRLER